MDTRVNQGFFKNKIHTNKAIQVYFILTELILSGS